FRAPAGSPAARLSRSMGIAPAVWRAVISASAAITRASAGTLLAHSAGRLTLGRLAPRRPLTDYRNQQESVLGALAAGYALPAVAAHGQTPRPTAGAPAGGTGAWPRPDTPWAPLSSADAPAGGNGAGDGPDTAWAPWSAVDRDLALLKAAATAQAQATVSACRVHSGAPGFAAVERLNAYRGLAHAYMNAGGDNELILYDTARAMADQDRYTPPPPVAGPPDDGALDSPAVWLFLARDTERRMRDRPAARIRRARSDGDDPLHRLERQPHPGRPHRRRLRRPPRPGDLRRRPGHRPRRAAARPAPARPQPAGTPRRRPAQRGRRPARHPRRDLGRPAPHLRRARPPRRGTGRRPRPARPDHRAHRLPRRSLTTPDHFWPAPPPAAGKVTERAAKTTVRDAP